MTGGPGLDDRLPFVRAALEAPRDPTAADRASALVADACARLGVRFVDAEGATPGRGVFAPRIPTAAPSPARVAALARSWEQFDRAFAPLSVREADAALRRGLWPLLDATPLLLPGSDFAGLLAVLGDGAVASLDAAGWSRTVAAWATSRRLLGRAWRADEIGPPLETHVPGYDAFRRGARAALLRVARGE